MRNVKVSEMSALFIQAKIKIFHLNGRNMFSWDGGLFPVATVRHAVMLL